MRIGTGSLASAMMAAVTLLLLTSAAMAEENYCLSTSEVAAVVAVPVSQSGDRVAGGPPELLAQNCKYERKAPYRVVDMTAHISRNAHDGANVFQAMSKSFGSMMGPPKPVSGLGDEAILYPSSDLWVRKNNVVLYFNLTASGLTDDQKTKTLKLLATKAFTHIH